MGLIDTIHSIFVANCVLHPTSVNRCFGELLTLSSRIKMGRNEGTAYALVYSVSLYVR